MLDELYDTNELQPEFVEETEKPYDRYLKLHNYDPKTNTIEIDGKRVNAGSRGSNKQHNRMNKILRENDYDPKTGTYKSDIKVKNPKTGNVENQRVKLNFNPHEDTQVTTSRGQYYDDHLNFDRTNINIPPKDLAKKPKNSGSGLKHEEGHIHDKNNSAWTGYTKSKEIANIKKEAQEANEKDFENLKYSDENEQMEHAKDPGEKYADLYGELHNKQGFGGTKSSMNHFKSTIKDPLSANDKEWLKDQLSKNEKARTERLDNIRNDKDEIIDTVLSGDLDYEKMVRDRNAAVSKVKFFAEILKLSPEERLKACEFPSERIEEIKKSGRSLEDVLDEYHLDDESIQSRIKEWNKVIDKSKKDIHERRHEMLNDKNVRKGIKSNIEYRKNLINLDHNKRENKLHDYLDNKKLIDAELNSRTNFVERKIRELAEKDPEVKRKLAEYDAAIARRKQKLEKRKANKAEARAKREASESTTESYYVPFEPEVDIVF
jgi:hypothetical protein